MNWSQFQGSLELGLIYSLVAVGVFLSFRILQFPDLTVDGSFPLGAAVCAALILKGVPPLLAVLLAGLMGALWGWVTAFLSNRLRLLNLLAGILSMSALYSINLRVMGGKPNLSLLGERTLWSGFEDLIPSQISAVPLLLILSVLGVSTLVVRFLNSQMGLAIRSVGCNVRMARANGVSDQKMIAIGLSLSNFCVALGGALFSQVFGFSDVTLGVGTVIIGLASVILGESLFPNKTMSWAVLGCVIGSILYRIMIAIALNLGDLGLQASDLNLVTALLITSAMGLPRLKKLLIKKQGEICLNLKTSK